MSELIELVITGLPGMLSLRFMLTNPDVGYPAIMAVLMLAALSDVMSGRLP